jgi:glycerol-3-phosphate O-acyltransferase
VSVQPALTGSPDRAHDGPLLFIVETQNRLERRLMEEWLDQAAPGRARERVFLKISKGRVVGGLDLLGRKLEAPDSTLLVPARMNWVVPGNDGGANAPLALRHLMFGDPRQPGGVRGRWMLWRDRARAQGFAGEPATLGALKERFRSQIGTWADEAPEEFTAFVARQAGLALEIAEWGLIGRRYKVPRFIAESLDSSPQFRAALAQLSAETDRPVADMKAEAAGYLAELVAEPSTLFVDLRARLDNWILSLAYDRNVVCREEDLEWLRRIVQTRPAMLLFTHKTYIDSVALTSKLFERDFPMLHIFAGANMGFIGLGFLLRRSGGIFIRRSFQDKPMYKLVLRHYIAYLMEKHFPMTWAFEGTRSRTGKLMPPRYGLLKYVIEAAHGAETRDIHVIPVTVSYDLMRDVEEYASEQTGRVKNPESLKWFIGYLSSLRQPMGRMYLDFGEPVVLPEAPDPDDGLALSKIAFEVAVQANRVTPITLPAIGCMVLLGAAPRALTLRELQADILRLVRWARDRGIRRTSDFSPDRLAEVRELADRMVAIKLLIRYDEGSDVVFGIDPDQHPIASYYRNTIIHHFVNKAILEMALLGTADRPEAGAAAAFWRETERLRDLFKFEFFYPEKQTFRRQLEEELGRVHPGWRDRLEEGGPGMLTLLAGMRPLVAHATLLQFVEAYSVVFDLLARLDPAATLEEAECVNRALKQGKQAYLQRRITSEASIGKILFGNGYKLAANLGLTAEGDAEVAGRRIRLLQNFKELSLRLERIRLMALSDDAARRSRPGKVPNDATT